MSFPTFNGAAGEDAQEFLDNLEIACLVIGRDDDATRLRVFPLLMKAEAKACFNTLLPANRGDWAGLRVLFLAKFGGGGETSESLWGKVCELRQGSLFEYNMYELQFVELWERWVASLRLGEAAPDFLKKDRFVAGLCPPLREKVKGRFLVTWMDARDIARLKERKIRYQLQQREADQEEEGMAPVPPTNAPVTHRGQGNQDQQELLNRITHQLEDLSVHLVRGGRAPPPNQEQARGPRRQAQEYHCYNSGENGHGMYYCPHPRRIGNFRGPRNKVSPPKERQQQPPPFPIQQAPPVQILRPPVQPQPQQPPPPPPPIAPIPPLHLSTDILEPIAAIGILLVLPSVEAIVISKNKHPSLQSLVLQAFTKLEVMVGAIKFKEPLFQGQETMEDILYFLETSECPKHLESVQRHRLVRKALSNQLIGEHLYHKGKDLVLRRVPLVKEIEKILMSCHDGVCGGHFAQEITSRKILQAGFVWPSLHRDVQHWCKACKACQQASDRKLSYGPRFPIFAYGPFEKWGIDAIGPLPRTSTDKQYILTATDYMTRWAEAASVARITAADVSKFVLDYICSRFGTPLEILSDRGPGFKADLLDALLENLSIKHVHSTPYYPQCNGLVEKTNGVLCKIITKHVRDRPQDWDKHLTAALWAYRTSFKVSTQFTPYHLVYGQEALLPIEVELGSLRVLARETTSSKEKLEQRILDLQRLELDREAATDYYITQANKKREQFNNKIKEKKLEEGMLVMRYDSRLDLSHSKKFLQRWEGPYVIFKKFKNGSYRLQDLSGKIHKYPINGWRLKEFFQRIQPIKEERQVSLDA
ncbi:hypothetical protein L7F22_014901 [Adiantum nelumboides]|nr:hypothetical protein [Adiantum nelumboides]